MAMWLIKTEPEEDWSWDDQLAAGVSQWSHVRNPQAQKYLRAMKTGERCFFYHTGKEKRIVGLVEVVREHYPDPSDPSGKCEQVDVKALKPLVEPVTLARIKADPALSPLALVRQPRLSVMPVDAPTAKRLLALGRTAL